MQRQFFSGNTIEQAVMAAARHYQVEPEKLSYKQREKKHGFLNVRKRIVIEVDPNSPVLTEEELAAEVNPPRPEPIAKTEPSHSHRIHRDQDSDEDKEWDGDDSDENEAGVLNQESEDESFDDDDYDDDSFDRRDRPREKRAEQPRNDRYGDRGGRGRQKSDRPQGKGKPKGRGDRDVGRSQEGNRSLRGNRDQGHREDDRDQGRRNSNGRDSGRRNQNSRDHGRRDQSRGRGGRSHGRRDSNRDKRKPVEINEFEWLGVDWDETEIKDEVERDLAAYELALEQVLDVMDLDIEYSLEAGDVMGLDFEGEDSKILLDDDGRVLKAIEHILPRMVRSLVNKSIPCNADCEGFRANHERKLEEMALNAAESALDTGRKKVLAPMSPADRRIVHLALVDRPDIETVSEGHGFMKRVKVIPLDEPDQDDDFYED